MNKIALVRVDKVLTPYKTHIVNNIHDDIMMLHYKSEVNVPGMVKREMERWPMFQVPIKADGDIAWPSWADKRSMTEEEKVLYEKEA